MIVMDAVVYARFSSSAQREVSIADQLVSAKQFADDNDMEIVREYTDHAISGRSNDRPALQRMLRDMDTYDAVIIWNTDRLNRNMFNAFADLGALTDAGKRIYSITQPELNDDNQMKLLLYSIYSWKDQRYSEDLSKNVSRGMRGKAERCQYLGYETFGYSHDGDTITADESNSRWVKTIYDRYVAGDTIMSIVEELRHAGVRTGRGNIPSWNFVNAILHNERYLGIYIWKDIRIEDGIPALITRDMWERAQDRVNRRTRKDRKHDYMLSGILVCAECGEYMHGESAKDGKATYYACKGKRRSCNGSVRVEKVDSKVVQAVRGVFDDWDTCEHVVEQFMDVQKEMEDGTDIKAWRKELKSTVRKRENVIKAISEGLPMTDAKPMLQRLRTDESDLRRRIEESSKKERTITDDDLYAFLGKVRDGDYDDTDVVRAFVNEVYLYHEKVIVVTNIGAAPTSLLEVETAIGDTGTCKESLVDQQGRVTNVLYLSNGLGLVVGL